MSNVSRQDAMPRFEIYSRGTLVGWSELELGDPSMGVAFGRFLPGPAYSSIQSAVAAADGGSLPESLQLSIRENGGPFLQASGGVHLVDYSAEVGAEGLEVSVLGVAHPSYELIFPEHVAAYERQFSGAG